MYSPPTMYSSAVQVVHICWTIIEYTVVRATLYVLYCTFRCTQRLLGIRVYSCAFCTSRRYYPAVRMYHASQQTVSADGLQDNSQHRKRRGIKTAISAPSIRPDLCIWSRGFSGTCRRASLMSFRGCDLDVANSARNGGLPPRHPLKLRPWLKDNTRAVCPHRAL